MKRLSFSPALAYIFCAFLVLGSLNCVAEESNPTEVSPQPSFSVGYSVLDFRHVKDQHDRAPCGSRLDCRCSRSP
jgi:hypothetical protein